MSNVTIMKIQQNQANPKDNFAHVQQQNNPCPKNPSMLCKKVTLFGNKMIFILICSFISNTVFSATITVCPSGCDHTTLAAAVAAANAGDVIQISPGIYPAANILIDKDLQIIGVSGLSFIEGSFPNRHFRIAPGKTVKFINLALINGHVDGDIGGGAIFNEGTLNIEQVTFQHNHADLGSGSSFGGSGGAIYNKLGATLNILNSTFIDNENDAGGDGGAIFNRGTVTIDGSTFERDTAVNSGGAIANSGGVANITNSTFTNNFADEKGGAIGCGGGTVNLNFVTISNNECGFPDAGGGIWASGSGIMNVKNSIIANNLDRDGAQDCALDGFTPGTINLQNRNVIEDGSCGCSADPNCLARDPNLGPLAANGGPTWTMVPMVCSPAISFATNSSVSVDQRGQLRPQGAMADVGAVEVNYAYPVIACKAITVDLNASGNVTIAANAVDNGSSDPSCGQISYSLSKSTFDCSDVGNNQVVMTFTNGVGVFKTCTANVTIRDVTPPNVQCKSDVIKVISTGGTVSLTAQEIDNGSSDACGIASMSVIPNSFTCADTGMQQVVLTVTDKNNNSASCTTIVEIQDEPPIAKCKDVTLALDVNGMLAVIPNHVNNGSTAPCGFKSMTVSPNSFSCSDVGLRTVTLTVQDFKDRMSICTAQVTIIDNIPPVAKCKPIESYYLDQNGLLLISGSDIDNGSTDACGIGSLSVTPNSFTCANIGLNPVILTVTDNNAKAATCTTSIMVVDTVSPVPVCQDITLHLDALGNASITADTIDNGSNDACGIASLSLDVTAFTCADVGPNSVILTVIDNNNNSATCSAVVTVKDTVAPMALCQDLTIYLDKSGHASITPEMVDNGSNDACGIKSLMLDTMVFDCDDLGSNLVVLTVTDNNDNTDTCHAIIFVEDIQIFTIPDIVGMSPICPGLLQAPYSVVPDPNVTSYQWSYSGNGAIINNNGKPNVTIDFAPDATHGFLTVEYYTICQPSGITDDFSVVKGSEVACALAMNCQENLLVINTMISFPTAINLFKASNSVNSTATVEDAETVIFRAGQEINLLQNFEVEKGALFAAEIEGCFESFQVEEIRKKE